MVLRRKFDTRKPNKSNLRKAKDVHRQRSRKAREVDESSTSKTTPHFVVWVNDPARWDMIGVDDNKKKRGKHLF